MPSTYDEIAHLLRRSGFGGLRPEIDAMTQLDWADAVEQVLDISGNPDANQGVPDLTPGSTTWTDRYTGMTHFWLDRARTNPAPIQEKMVLFWHGHLVSGMDKVQHHSQLFDQNQLFRTDGMGNVIQLFQKMALQPAMLFYLDNDENTKGSPNENFARELMELFTLGQGHYTEEDVQESARAWTGHGLEPWVDNDTLRAYQFWPNRHDDGQKTFMGITRNWDGPEIIDHLFNGGTKQAAANFLSAKLWSYFAYPRPDAAVVSTLASTFIASDWNITALLRAIFLHPEFRSERAINGLIRTPFEYAVAAMRHLDLPSSEVQPQWYLDAMGQRLFDPPNVSGWRQNEYWVSSTAVWAKSQFADRVRWMSYERGLFADYADLSVEESVGRAFEQFGIPEVSPATKDSVETYVEARRQAQPWAEQSGLLFLPLLTPEFQMA